VFPAVGAFMGETVAGALGFRRLMVHAFAQTRALSNDSWCRFRSID